MIGGGGLEIFLFRSYRRNSDGCATYCVHDAFEIDGSFLRCPFILGNCSRRTMPPAPSRLEVGDLMIDLYISGCTSCLGTNAISVPSW